MISLRKSTWFVWLHTPLDTRIQRSAHNCCIVYFTELASKKFGRQASFSSAPRNGAQLFPLGFELLEFIGLAARKNETVTFSAWFMTAKQRC